MTTLLYALKDRDKKWGLQTMCEGGGLANVTIVERFKKPLLGSARRECGGLSYGPGYTDAFGSG